MESSKELFEQLRSGDREALAKSITLIESERDVDRAAADELLRSCFPHGSKSLILGVTGIPGAGKSTLLNALGMHYVEEGRRVAVLAIDPSSNRSKGSILGDKTRMEDLSRSDSAFIRPSPTSGVLGGVSRRTREAALLCAAAGYDLVFIETVGVGQNELEIDDLADLTVLLLLSGTGDELQGIKRGIMEAADLMVINKVEEEHAQQGKAAAMQLRNSLELMPPRDSGLRPKVLTTSAISGHGIPELKRLVDELYTQLSASGTIPVRRARRKRRWLTQRVEDSLLKQMKEERSVQEMARLGAELDAGHLDPVEASELYLEFMKKDAETPS